MSASDFRITAVGTDIEAWAPSGGWPIRGVRIDNPSGSWLSVSPYNRWVPPYTLNWRASLKPAVSTITVRFQDGPVGKLSTLVGNEVTIIVYDEEIPDSNGVAIIGTTRPDIQAITIEGSATDKEVTWGVISAPGATTRLRIFSVMLAYAFGRDVDLFGVPADICNAPIFAAIRINTPPPAADHRFGLAITPSNPTDAIVFSDLGYDLPLNTALNADMLAPWSPQTDMALDAPFRLSALYGVV